MASEFAIMRFDTFAEVTTALTLAAFIAATALRAFINYLRTREREIRTVPASKRAELVAKTLEFLRVDTNKLPKDRQYDIALEQVRQRAERSKRQFYAVLFLAILGTIIVLALIIKDAGSRPAEVGRSEIDEIKARLEKNEKFQEQAIAIDGEGTKRELSAKEKDEAKYSRERGTPLQKFIAGIALDHCQDLDREYQALEQQSPGERYRILMLRGDAWYRCRQFEKAAGIFEEALRMRPKDFEACNSAARAHFAVHHEDIDGNRKRVECSRKPDPCGMRVQRPELGERTFDERQEALTGADHQEAA
jgi:tetratricopeptide (TPR) repeat protein